MFQVSALSTVVVLEGKGWVGLTLGSPSDFLSAGRSFFLLAFLRLVPGRARQVVKKWARAANQVPQLQKLFLLLFFFFFFFRS
jgi:hypothetical protein